MCEHVQWGMTPEFTIIGGDLYTTFWATVAGMVRRMADESSRAEEEGHEEIRWKGIRRDRSFLMYATNSKNSPPLESLKKLGEPDDSVEWHRFLEWPYFYNQDKMEAMTRDARIKVDKLAAMATSDANGKFHKRLSDSIQDGGNEMHKFVKNEKKLDPTIRDKEGNYINDIMHIISHHTDAWAQQWLSEDRGAAAEAVKALKKLRQIAAKQVEKEQERRGSYNDEEVRKAAKKFKTNTTIGVGHWTFSQIFCMPDPVLEDLGNTLWKAKLKMVVPHQTYLNILASLPKKTGDTRTVAIMTTFYMVLMELDDARLQEFEGREGYDGSFSGPDGGGESLRSGNQRVARSTHLHLPLGLQKLL